MRELGVNELVVAGVFADACVKATVNSALARGYRVAMLREGVAAKSERARALALAKFERQGVWVAESLEHFDKLPFRAIARMEP